MERDFGTTSEDEGKDMESCQLMDEESHIKPQTSLRRACLPFFLKFSTLSFAVLSLELAVYPNCQTGSTTACERGVRETDLGMHLILCAFVVIGR